MMTAPRVTILLPVYNGEQHLAAALASLGQQTFEDVEVLVIDDGSTDATPEIAASFHDDRIRWHRNDRNEGIVQTLNRGLELARGELVARADHDDLSLPHRIERQVAALDAQPTVAVAGGWFDVIDETGHILARPRRLVASRVELVYLLLVDQLPLHHPTVMYRRDAVRTLGGYDETMRLAEDKDLWRRLAVARLDVRIVPEVLVQYRVHSAQESQVHLLKQKERDAQSHERFLNALSPEAPAREIRLLLTGRAEAWNELSATGESQIAEALERLVHDTSTKLGLDQSESRQLSELLGKRVAAVASRAWRSSVSAQWRASPALWKWGLRSASQGASAPLAVRYAATMATAPLLRPARSAADRGLRWLTGRRLLSGARSAASRSPFLRRIYAAALRYLS